MAFVWNKDKAASNLKKHGISFEYATRVFLSPVQIEWVDRGEDYGEDRWNVVGLIDTLELLVTYTVRGEDIRIIAARRATKHEREEFWRG